MVVIIGELYIFREFHQDLINRGFGFIYFQKEKDWLYVHGITPVAIARHDYENNCIKIATLPGSAEFEEILDKYPFEVI